MSKGKDKEVSAAAPAGKGGRAAAGKVPSTTAANVDIVAGFTQLDWTTMIERDDSDDLARTLVDELMSAVETSIYDSYIERQTVPYTLHSLMTELLDVVDLAFLPHDDVPQVDTQHSGLVPDEEPEPGKMECWSPGAVPTVIITHRQTLAFNNLLGADAAFAADDQLPRITLLEVPSRPPASPSSSGRPAQRSTLLEAASMSPPSTHSSVQRPTLLEVPVPPSSPPTATPSVSASAAELPRKSTLLEVPSASPPTPPSSGRLAERSTLLEVPSRSPPSLSTSSNLLEPWKVVADADGDGVVIYKDKDAEEASHDVIIDVPSIYRAPDMPSFDKFDDVTAAPCDAHAKSPHPCDVHKPSDSSLLADERFSEDLLPCKMKSVQAPARVCLTALPSRQASQRSSSRGRNTAAQPLPAEQHPTAQQPQHAAVTLKNAKNVWKEREIEFNSDGNVVSMKKINPASLPSDRVDVGFHVLKPPEHHRCRPPAPRKTRRQPKSAVLISKCTGKPVTRSVGRKPAKKSNIATYPPMVNAISLSAGVMFSEGGKVKSGPKPLRGGISAADLKPLTASRLQSLLSVGDVAEQPAMCLPEHLAPLPPISAEH